MGKFYNALVADAGSSARINSINGFFNSLEGITSEVITYTYNNVEFSAVSITIDGTEINVIYGLQNVATVYTGAVSKAVNGEKILFDDTYSNNPWGGQDGIIVSAYLDEKCIIIYISKPNSAAQNGPLGFEIVYLKGIELLGYKVFTTVATATNLIDISTLDFEDMNDDGRIKYTYTNMFPYTATAGTIDFTNEAFFINNGVRHFTSDFLKECSTVPLLSTQSIPVGNCMAIGAHCLVSLDDE